MTSLLRPFALPGATETAAEPVISMVDVGMTYPNGKVALADVNVEIAGGDFVFLVGPSGAGKSTFIRLLIREQLPTTGSVRVAGRDLLRMRRGQVPGLRRRIGIVFQDFRLLPEQDRLGERRVRARRDRRGRVAASASACRSCSTSSACTTMRITCRPSCPAASSSGPPSRGRSSTIPAILIADEPTGNLDPVTSWEIIQLLIQINELGTTVLMATHNQEIVNAMRRRVLALEGGHLVRDEAAAAYEREY